jgi:hypothetical protein
MAINPSLINTIRVDQLPYADIIEESIIPHAIGEVLYKGFISDLIGYIRPLISTAFQYEIRDLWVDEVYAAANFEPNGLGKNICIGWAICNGNNGTPDASARTSVMRGSMTTTSGFRDFPLKTQGGDHGHILTINQMPSHSHGLEQINRNTGDSNTNPVSFYDQGFAALPHGKRTDTEGNGGTHNNMPPYFVCLKIMKL